MMASNALRLHELSAELDPDEAGLMKQQSRIEEAQRMRLSREELPPAHAVPSDPQIERSRAKG